MAVDNRLRGEEVSDAREPLSFSRQRQNKSCRLPASLQASTLWASSLGPKDHRGSQSVGLRPEPRLILDED